MNKVRSSIARWRRLPLALKLVWFSIGTGVALLAWGYLNRIPSMSWTGLGVYLAGYAGGFLDGLWRKTGRDEATPFYIALVTSPIAGALFSLIVIVIATVLFVGIALFGEFSWGQVLRILHFIGVMFCACVFISLSGVARTQTEHEGGQGAENEADPVA